MIALLKLVCIIFLIVVLACIWKTAEFFNELPDRNRYKPVLSWDLLVMAIVAIGLVIKLLSI